MDQEGSGFNFQLKPAGKIAPFKMKPSLSRNKRLKTKGGRSNRFGGLISGLGQKVLGQTANMGLRFLRKNYALLQYTQNNIKNRIDLTLRWTQNLDDGSCQSATLLAYSFGNHLELFSVGTLNLGGKNTEFGSILNYQWMVGLKYTF